MRDKEYLILGKEESYKASSKVWAFQKVDDIVHGIALKLTNMVGCFPFEYNDYRWADSERLYLCGGFSNNTQNILLFKPSFANLQVVMHRNAL